MPGSPLAHLAGEDPGALGAPDRARVIRDAGLDRPLHEQYAGYLSNLVRGDLGYSYQQQKPVGAVLLDRLPWTVLLTGSALIIATSIGIVLGAVAAWRRGRRLDMSALVIFIVLQSLPAFWVGMLLVAVFGVPLGLFPTFGSRDVFSRPGGAAYWADVGRHLALPALTLVIVTVSEIFLAMRYSMVSALGDEYVVVARAKGYASAACSSVTLSEMRSCL